MNIAAKPVPAGSIASYDDLAALFRPTFQRIAEDAVRRDAERILPHEQVGWLKQLRFGALRLPVEAGGYGASLVDLVRLLSELAAADSNLVQIFRAHFGFAENLLTAPNTDWSRHWRSKVAAGEIVSAGWTEPGTASNQQFSTKISRDGDRWRLDGRKYYTTGALFSEWIDVGATNPEGETVSIIVQTSSPGLVIIDDWNGFGQVLTASGTAVLSDITVPDADILPVADRFAYQLSFYQVFHLAALAGLARAAADAATDYVEKRRRNFSHAAATLARHDPQVLQLLGRVHALAYSAGQLTTIAAARLQQVFEVVKAGREADIAALDIEIYQAQVVVAEQALEATTILFNGLGASALSTELGLDRYWRNARTVASHNPVIYKERIIGDYAVNRTPPPESWLSGAS